MIAYALSRAKVVTYDSDDAREAIAKIEPRVPTCRVVNGPEHTWATASRHEAPIVFGPRPPIPFYNSLTILLAFAKLFPQHQEWRLEIACRDEGALDLRRVANDEARGVPVRFLPWLDRTQMQTRFLKSAIFCSVPSHDATSASLLEGMAAGAFPIVSDVPANHEWVSDGYNGLIVRAGSVSDLCAALDRAMTDHSFRARAGCINRALVAEKASWERALDAMLKGYEIAQFLTTGRALKAPGEILLNSS